MCLCQHTVGELGGERDEQILSGLVADKGVIGHGTDDVLKKLRQLQRFTAGQPLLYCGVQRILHTLDTGGDEQGRNAVFLCQ